jgi:hypothetical protein
MALESTQTLREISTRNLPRGKGQPARKVDLTAICEPACLENVGASTSQSYGPPRLVTGIALPYLLTFMRHACIYSRNRYGNQF